MITKKVPLRQCTGCGEMNYKKEMIRVIKTPEEQVFIDATGKKNGRGAYICCSIDCLSKAIKTKALEKSLKMKIPKDVYEELERELKELESR
jgi:predicted RNA-binding protein YlxR (DUF448 family)